MKGYLVIKSQSCETGFHDSVGETYSFGYTNSLNQLFAAVEKANHAYKDVDKCICVLAVVEE